jgi:hypothetical protein
VIKKSEEADMIMKCPDDYTSSSFGIYIFQLCFSRFTVWERNVLSWNTKSESQVLVLSKPEVCAEEGGEDL